MVSGDLYTQGACVSPGHWSLEATGERDRGRIVVSCQGELGALVRCFAARLGVRVTSCHSALQAAAEACHPASVLVLLTHEPSEHDWSGGMSAPLANAGGAPLPLCEPQAHGPPLCRVLRELRCAARVVCLEATEQVSGSGACAADARIEAPRTPAGLVKILDEIRVAGSPRPKSGTGQRRVLKTGDLVIDVDRRRVLLGNVSLELSKGQYDLLVALVESEGCVIPFRELHRIACSLSAWTGDTRSVRQQVSKLMRKLQDHSLTIHNVRGVGYALTRKADSA